MNKGCSRLDGDTDPEEVPAIVAVLLMEVCGWDSIGQQASVCWKLLSRCLLFCMRLYSCLMLLRICSVVRTEDTVPKGDGSMRRYFCGEELEEDGDMGAHLLLFGDAGFIKGSKSIVRFRVAPQAILTKACV